MLGTSQLVGDYVRNQSVGWGLCKEPVSWLETMLGTSQLVGDYVRNQSVGWGL